MAPLEAPRARRALLLGNAVANGAMALASVGGALTVPGDREPNTSLAATPACAVRRWL